MAGVLLIGDSQTGALLHRIKRHRDIAVAAAPGKAFLRMSVTSEGRINGARYLLHGAESVPLSAFALIYVYADLPEPVALLPARPHRFSTAYMAAFLEERLAATGAVRLARQMAQHTDKNRIILIPKPINAKRAGKGFPYVDGRAATRQVEAATGFPIAHLKSALYSINWEPDPMFYANSLDWRGGAADATRAKSHDMGHLNTRGGSRVFDALQRDIGDRLGRLSRPSAQRDKRVSIPPAA